MIEHIVDYIQLLEIENIVDYIQFSKGDKLLHGIVWLFFYLSVLW